MPKVKADYSNTIIYKLCCNDPSITEIYIGHTTNFTQRKHNHHSSCYNSNLKYYNILVYKFIRNNGGWNNWSMLKIEDYNCNDKYEAINRERYWIETLKSKLNVNNPIATDEEKIQQKKDWYEENKDKILEKGKINYGENKEQKLEYQKQYTEDNKDKIKEQQNNYRDKNKDKLAAQKKIYREQHKAQSAQANKEWKKANKEKLKELRAEVINCECGNQYTFGNKIRHLQSKIHTEYTDKLCGIVNPVISEEEEKVIEETKKKKISEQQKEYRKKNADYIKEWKKQHYGKNKQQITTQNMKYYHDHQDEIKEQSKIYQENNKEKIQLARKKRYQENKEKILESQKEMITCECGAHIRKTGKNEHCKSTKHQDYILSKNTIQIL